ncbi:oligopeptide/dipeptide ABC transporter ATP-binding protein [Ethanoligenens harbinense]|uniref:oligopeptide/dipeptide ABC transporter ATP-binding protein n=1 Tax=Ethanoligenens harbinense TaxID=253239 RepID=UPI000EA3AA9A|nr:ABC transporter ATP-binding protein [Ethanoligenens harbinense]AYF41773.1 dipeptide/oligopeptide/nickel ABC transporter ATP-binding protein [Ethanoligenens harbinense]
MNDLLCVKALNKQYTTSAGLFGRKRTVSALEDVSFHIARGKTLGLIGESGCGKSTTGNILAGLLKADGGEVMFDGKELLHAKKTQVATFRRQIKLVFQDPGGSFNPSHTVLWSLHEELLGAGVRVQREQDRRIDALLPKVGLDRAYCLRYPSQLSGGQKQRAAILSALLTEPRLIIADEVVSALDLSVQAQILNLMRELQAQLGLAYLFISHDLGVVYHMSDSIAVMYRGHIVEYGTADQVFHTPAHPYTRLLLSALPQKPVEKTAEAEAGEVLPAPSDQMRGCRFVLRCPHRIPACSTATPPIVSGEDGHMVRCILLQPNE